MFYNCPVRSILYELRSKKYENVEFCQVFGGGALLSFLQGFYTCQTKNKMYNSDMKHHYAKFGFTLSEVLITLGIVGVVAVLVLPAFIDSYMDKQYAAMWKKKYSEIANVYYEVKEEMGGNICVRKKEGNFDIPTKCIPPGEYMLSSKYATLSPEFVKNFVSRLKVIDSCGYPQYGESEYCANYYQPWTGLCGGSAAYGLYDSLMTSSPASSRKQLMPAICRDYAGTMYTGWDYMFKAVLQPDGTTIYFGGYATGLIVVDVNSFAKGPNVVGKDLFAAMVNDDWIKPIGAEGTFSTNINGKVCQCSKEVGLDRAQGFLGSGDLLNGTALSGVCCSATKLYSN